MVLSRFIKAAIVLTFVTLMGCIGKYDLKSYHIGVSANKNIYGNTDLGLAPNAYTSTGITTSFDFAK
jgi:hypothetical protein